MYSARLASVWWVTPTLESATRPVSISRSQAASSGSSMVVAWLRGEAVGGAVGIYFGDGSSAMLAGSFTWDVDPFYVW